MNCVIAWQRIKESLAHIETKQLDAVRCCIGFDGYVDELYRVVKSRVDSKTYVPYPTISSFAERANAAAERSADMEIVPIGRRIGGNAPLMSKAIARLGVDTHCLGAMGQPECDPVFMGPHALFQATSIADCAKTIAFEFTDGKLMFGNISPLHSVTWETIKQTVGLEALTALYQRCILWGIVNWSFLLHCNGILEGIMQEVLPVCPPEEVADKIIFFDLADPSGRPKEDLVALCGQLRTLGQKMRVVLGLNENEALRLATALDIEPHNDGMEAMAIKLMNKLNIDLIALHGANYAIGVTADRQYRAESVYNVSPCVTTGGGDHFNAGLCVGLLSGLTAVDALSVGNIVSSYYVTYGESPTLRQLIHYTEIMANQMEAKVV